MLNPLAPCGNLEHFWQKDMPWGDSDNEHWAEVSRVCGEIALGMAYLESKALFPCRCLIVMMLCCVLAGLRAQ